MALEQLVNGMTGQQLANTIKNNFDKVLDVESAENKAENAGKALKTDYDATRYVEMELADGTPIRMRWDVFCQAIASVVAEQIGTENSKNSLFPANTFSGFRLKASSTKLFKVTRNSHFTVTFLVGDSQAAGYPGRIYLGAISRDTNGNIKTSIKPLLYSSIYHKIKYRLNADNTIDVVLYRTQYSPVVGCFILSGNGYISGICSDISDSEVDDTFIDFTEVE